MTAEPSSRDSPDEDRDGAEELLFECLERIELEGEGAIDELLAAHPEHAETVRARLVALRGVGLVGKARPDQIPERLGDFRLIERLGGGGMGVVYLAEQESLGRRVALKLIRPEHLYFPGSRERFRREVRAVALMQHPGIVPVYTVGEEDGVPYFAMERIEGCTLAEVLERLSPRAPGDLQGRDLVEAIELCSDPAPEGEEPPRPPFGGSWTDACLQLVRQVALALTHAHARGVLHRDVKPSNIAIDRSGRAMLLDFGLASAEGADHLTRSGSQPGSLPYMSPEQVRGERELDARTDVYSLGVTLYELLTLRRPFAAETTELVRSRILEGAAPGVRRLNRGVPWDVETVCLTAIERRREDRYPGIAGLARDLENLMGRRPIEARRPGPWLRLLRWAQRHPTASVGSALVLVLVAIAMGFVAWQQKLYGDQLERRGIELQEQRDIARERFEEMRKQATSLLFELHDSIQFLAGSTRARELLVGRAIELLERLSEVAEEEPELRSELAVAYAKLGDILGNPQMSSLGDLEGAQVQYEKAMSLFDQALAANPTEWRLKKNRCEAIGCLALVAQARGDLEAEASWLERGTRAAEELYENHPAQLTRLDMLGRNLQLRSQFLMRVGRGDEAMECALRAVELYEELGRDLPGDADTEMKLALALGESARILTGMGHQLEARENLERALALWEDRIGADPDNAWIRGVRSRDQLLLSGVQSAMGESAEALESARAAAAEVEALVASDPRNAECKRQLQFALLTCGPLALSFGEVGEAIEHLERALHVGEEVLALGEDVSAADLNRYGRIQLARAYLVAGDRVACLEHNLRCVADYERALAERPASDMIRGLYVATLWQVEEALRFAGAEPEAVAVLEQAVEEEGAEGQRTSDRLALSAAHLFRARVGLIQQLDREAEDALERSRRILEEVRAQEPDHPQVAAQGLQLFDGLARVWLRAGDDEEALALYREGLEWSRAFWSGERSSRLVTHRLSDLVRGLVSVSIEMDEGGEVERLERRLLEMLEEMAGRADPSFVEIHALAGWLLDCETDRLRDPVRAHALAERAVELTPQGQYLCMETLARACLRIGRPDDALVHAESARSGLPPFADEEERDRLDRLCAECLAAIDEDV